MVGGRRDGRRGETMSKDAREEGKLRELGRGQKEAESVDTKTKCHQKSVY